MLFPVTSSLTPPAKTPSTRATTTGIPAAPLQDLPHHPRPRRRPSRGPPTVQMALENYLFRYRIVVTITHFTDILRALNLLDHHRPAPLHHASTVLLAITSRSSILGRRARKVSSPFSSHRSNPAHVPTPLDPQPFSPLLLLLLLAITYNPRHENLLQIPLFLFRSARAPGQRRRRRRC
jgi:hypothetical protein